MSRSIGSACFALLTLASFGLTAAANAAAGAERTRYRVRVTLEGVGGPANFDDCPAQPGKEVLEGTVGGIEAELASNQQVEYSGVVERRTNSAFCDLKGEGDTTHYCVTKRDGRSKVKLRIKIYSDRDGAFIQWTPVAGSGSATAAGDCDPDITDFLRTSYMKDGESVDMPTVPKGRLVERRKTVETEGGAITTLEVLGKEGLEAKAGGPYNFERAASITLDGSGSTPSPGHSLQSYEWELTPSGTPDGCAGIGQPTRMSGATVTFVALCSMTAKLTVRQDDGEQDDDDATVTVNPRPWRTNLTTVAKPIQENFTFVANGFVFGYNRCNRKDHFDEESNHWYEPGPGSKTDYEEGSFWLGQVTDSGPFAGTFFVTKRDFDVPRACWINKRLFKDGDVYDLNTGTQRQVKNCSGSPATCPFGEPVLDRLRESVEVHEKLHSSLAEGAVAGAKDPAIQIESSMAMDRTALKDRANLFMTTAVSDMTTASSESNVKAAMRNGKFSAGGCIDFPDWDGAIKQCYFHFPTFADKGERDMGP